MLMRARAYLAAVALIVGALISAHVAPAGRIHGGPFVPGSVLYQGPGSPRQGVSVDFAHGALQVDSGNRYLKQADGTPMPWVATTAWFAPTFATLAEWNQFLDVIKGQGYTVVQLWGTAPYSAWYANGITNANGRIPFSTAINTTMPTD